MIWQLLPIVGLLLAGIAHVLAALEHLAHQPAQGIAFVLLGVAQLVWALVAGRLLYKRRTSSNPQPPAPVFWTGVALSGGAVVLWLLTQRVATPFGAAHSELETALLVSKAGELLAFAGLLLGLPSRRRTPSPIGGELRRGLRPSPITGLLVAVIAGALVWSGGLAAQEPAYRLFPSLARTPHNTGTSDAQVGLTTSAYFSIVNRGEPDAIIGAHAPGVGEITLHTTTITDNVARMERQDAIELRPHTRVDFAPAGGQLMLSGLNADLYAGGTLEITLMMQSGRSVAVPFQLEDLPNTNARLNFLNDGDFQVSNAWAYSTASNATVSLGTPYTWDLPEGFPMPPVPADNPMTVEGVELGRHLFYDTRLSGNNTQACSSCHDQSVAFSDGVPRPFGSTEMQHPRNAQTLTNVAYNGTLTWANPTLLHLERQIPIPLFGEFPVEMGMTGFEDEVLNRLRQDANYQQLFAAAYPGQTDPYTVNNITRALSQFTRTLISGDSAYDQFTRGDTSAMSESAQRGMDLFFSERFECTHCHTGFNFSLSTITANSTFQDRPFFNTGLYNLDGQGAYPAENTGIHEITGNPADMGRFRPPTLRNIALTAPYMHDGSIETLEEVIRTYAAGGRVITEGEFAGDGRANPYKSGLIPGFTISDQEMDDLIAFLNSLTDEQFIRDPRFSNPFTDDLGDTASVRVGGS